MDNIGPPNPKPPEDPNILGKESFRPHVVARIAEAQKTGEPLTVAVVDIDNFKSVNDTLGHDRGDEVIAAFKQVAVDTFRVHDNAPADEDKRQVATPATDVIFTPEPSTVPAQKSISFAERLLRTRVGHIGGDEFALEIAADAEGAKIAADRLKTNWDKVLDLPENADIKELSIKPSIGLATLDAETSDMDSEAAATVLLKTADDDMYADKIRNIPNLTRKQRLGIRAAGLALKMVGIRQRDLPKFQKAIDQQRTQRKQG